MPNIKFTGVSNLICVHHIDVNTTTAVTMLHLRNEIKCTVYAHNKNNKIKKFHGLVSQI